jgi:hypothetical protein
VSFLGHFPIFKKRNGVGLWYHVAVCARARECVCVCVFPPPPLRWAGGGGDAAPWRC